MAKSTIIKELANNNISLEVALGRLFVIATDIDNNELKEWAECELNGYGENKVPDYRLAKKTFFKYSGINGGFKVENAPIPLPEILNTEDPSVFYIPITEGIGTIEGIVNSTENIEVGRDLTWAAGMVAKECGIRCYSIKQTIPKNVFQGVLSAVKMRLMKIFLELDKTYGCLDELDVEASAVSSEEITKTNNAIYKYIYVDNSISIGDKNQIEGASIVGRRDGNG